MHILRTSAAVSYTHLIDDLKFASENLPENPDNISDVGKLTKWAAIHLLSEVYLMAGEYAKAEEAALQVINSGYFHLMNERFGAQKDQPGDVFSDMFLEYNQNRTSGNMESIWVKMCIRDRPMYLIVNYYANYPLATS